MQRPAEIVNYRSMGTTPALLGAALAAGAVAALCLTLFASVRRRRRELALLKTIGFTRRQLAAAVAWQSTHRRGAGRHRRRAPRHRAGPLPLGPVRPADQRGARAYRPWPDGVLITFGALVLANIVAAVPGRMAARTPTALLLRAE